MKKMFLLFSHKLTDKQELDARQKLNVTNFVYLPEELQNKWSNIPSDIKNIDNYIMIFKNYLKENSNFDDYVLIQGDFGATCKMVQFCKELNLLPVYSTTNRIVEEKNTDGKIIKTSRFEHILFRHY